MFSEVKTQCPAGFRETLLPIPLFIPSSCPHFTNLSPGCPWDGGSVIALSVSLLFSFITENLSFEEEDEFIVLCSWKKVSHNLAHKKGNLLAYVTEPRVIAGCRSDVQLSKSMRLNHTNLKLFDTFDFPKRKLHTFSPLSQLCIHLCGLPSQGHAQLTLSRWLRSPSLCLLRCTGNSSALPLRSQRTVHAAIGSDGVTCPMLSQSWGHCGALAGLGCVPAFRTSSGALPEQHGMRVGRAGFYQRRQEGTHGTCLEHESILLWMPLVNVQTSKLEGVLMSCFLFSLTYIAQGNPENT